MSNIMEKLELTAQSMYCKKIEELTPSELHLSLGKAVRAKLPTTGQQARLSTTASAELTTSLLNFLWAE